MDGWVAGWVVMFYEKKTKIVLECFEFSVWPDVSLLWLRVWEMRTKTTAEKEFQTETEMKMTLTRPFLSWHSAQSCVCQGNFKHSSLMSLLLRPTPPTSHPALLPKGDHLQNYLHTDSPQCTEKLPKVRFQLYYADWSKGLRFIPILIVIDCAATHMTMNWK